jgi:VCBS repeat-containing protein
MHKILLDQAMELTQAQGECWIVLKDGSIKAVNVGDMLPKGVLLVSPSHVELTPPAPENAENHIPSDTIIPGDSEMDPAVKQELAAIQQAIQDGQDPAELAEATASSGATSTGNTTGGVAGSGNAGTTVTERSAKATISEAGFDTAHNSRNPQHQDPLPGDEVAGKIEHPPVAFDQTHVISEDTPTLFTHVPAALDLDSDGINPQGYTLVSGVQSGQLTLNADGSYQYIPAPEFQSLKEGETRQVSFTYIATDPSGNPSAPATVTITITGTNDTASISVATPDADLGAVKEDVTLTTGGKLIATDIDNGEAVFQPQTLVKGAHGTFTIDKEGNWTYQLDNKDPLVQALKEGGSLPSESFVVKSADGSAQHTVTVAITGTNDTASITVATPGADQGTVKEDVTLTTGGKLVATDIDNGEAVFEPQTLVKGAHGTFTIDKDGDWSYQLDNKDPLVQALKEGESLPSETFVVKSADGSAQHTVTVAITGTNDAPEFISNGDTPQGTDLDGKPTADHAQFNVPNLMSGVMVGKVTAIDPEAGDQLTYSLTEGQGDKFEINAKTGEIWLKEGVKLAHNEQAQHQLKVKVSDGVASDEMDVTVNVIENRVPVSHAIHGFADVEMALINKVTIIFDVSNSMTRTFDGTSTVRSQNQQTEALAPRYESRAYQAAEALHEMIGKMIAEGGQGNTYIRLVTFSNDAKKQGWFSLDEIYDRSKPPELNGRALTDSAYLSEVNSYVRNWCNIDSGIYTDYALAQETVMLADNDSRLAFPWQEAMAEGKTGMDYWNTLQKEQPVSSVNTVFFITDGEPNPQPGSVPAADLEQRWDDYVTAQNAKVYSIGIAVDGNPKVDEALHKIGDEVVYVNSGGNLSNYLNHFAPKPIGGDLLAGSTDADGDTLTVALAADRFSLLGADLHNVKIDGPLVTDSRLAEDGKLNLTTAFGVLAVASNGSYSFTQSDGSPLLDGQQVDLHFQFQVEDGRGGISDNVFTLTLNGGSVDQDRPVEVNTHTQAGDEQDNILTGTDQADVLLGQSGNDTLHGGDGNDILLGGSGSDNLYGNLGNDILTGGTGNDSLTGGLGNDILIGGRGADTFIWGRSDMTAGVETTDVIRDFSVAEHDSLDLANVLSPQADHNGVDNLLHYLQVEAKSDGVTIHVATEVADQFDLHIDLQGVQMAELSTHSTQNQILDDLLQANIIQV